MRCRLLVLPSDLRLLNYSVLVGTQQDTCRAFDVWLTRVEACKHVLIGPVFLRVLRKLFLSVQGSMPTQLAARRRTGDRANDKAVDPSSSSSHFLHRFSPVTAN